MPRASSATLKRRHQLVRDAAARHQLDALVVTTRSNILYLTNFTGSAAVAIVTADKVHFITDFRYVTALDTLQKSPHACPDLELSVVDGTYDATLIRVIGSLGVGRLGFEASNQYAYIPMDLAEKVLCCRDLLDRWLPAMRAK